MATPEVMISTTLSYNQSDLNISTDPNSTLANQRFPNFALPVIPEYVAHLYFALLCTSVALGIPGNVITAAAYAVIQNKSSCDWYILFVAMFDIQACAFRNTALIMEYEGVWLEYSNSAYCKIVGWMSQTSVCASICLFALIAVDRYTKLCSITCLEITPKRSRDVCIALTVINLFLAAPCLFIFDNLVSRGICQVHSSFVQRLGIKAYYGIIFALFLLMMLAVVFCYINIGIKVRQTRRVGTGINVVKTAEEPSYWNSGQVSSNTRDGLQGPDNLNRAEQRTENISMSSVTGFRPDSTVYDNFSTTISQLPQSPKVWTTSQPGPIGNGLDHLRVPPASTTDVKMARQDFLRVDQAGKTKSRTKHVKTSASAMVSPNTDKSATELLNKISRRRQNIREKRNLRVTNLLFVVTTVYIVSWIPPYAAMVKGLYIGYTWPFSMAELILVNYGPHIYIINTFSNPIIYAAMSQIYRRNVFALFTKMKSGLNRMCPTL